MGYVEFVRSLETKEDMRRWIEPLANLFRRMHHTRDRQQLLQYGVVVHALIDVLDPRHVVTSNRPSYPNKLSEKTRRNLAFRVFGVYLKFVSNKEKYLRKYKRGGGAK
jgi:hypothetical protein